MSHKGSTFISMAIGVLLITGSIFLLSVTPVKAQCGSQASSCMDCHETQAQDPVNNDGTTWHTQHAFGDFCYLCHAGNNQATDKVVAHTGMLPPLADINTSCKGCHPSDVLAKAQIYATTLGQQVGNGGTPAAETLQPAASAAPAMTGVAPAAVPTAIVPAADMVDYSLRYDAVALGKTPVNIGNIIMIALLAVIVLGGGYLVLKREGLIRVSFEDPKRIPIQKKYPVDVVEMLPGISRLKPASRRILQHILAKPRVAADLLDSIDKLSHAEPADLQPLESQPSEDQKE
jgi:hypothetical protein